MNFMSKNIALIVLLGACSAVWAGDRVNTIDARAFDAEGLTISAAKVEFTAGGKKESLDRTDVAEIVLGKASDPMVKAGQCVVLTADGAQLAAANLALSGTKLTCDNVLLGATEMALDAVRTIYQPDAKLTGQQVRQRCQDLKVAGGVQDILVVARSEADWTVMEGVLKGIDAERIVFTFEGADSAVVRKNVRAIWAAVLGKREVKAAVGTVVGVDGTSCPFTSLTADAKSIVAELPGIGKKTLARPDLAAIRFKSDRVVNLADLKPEGVKEHGLLDQKFPHRVNVSVSGKGMRLDGQAYSTGLGVHSFCELTYALGGAYGTFVTVAGIDDSVRPAGDATVTVLGDGKELDKPVRLTGKDKPVTVRVTVAGVKQLTIRVEYGPDNVDVSDHVDLAAARLIK